MESGPALFGFDRGNSGCRLTISIYSFFAHPRLHPRTKLFIAEGARRGEDQFGKCRGGGWVGQQVRSSPRMVFADPMTTSNWKGERSVRKEEIAPDFCSN